MRARRYLPPVVAGTNRQMDDGRMMMLESPKLGLPLLTEWF